MLLSLTITSYHKITPGQVSEKTMESGVMAIGRGQDNDWVLPDPERLVSSKHCVIEYKNGRYCITDNSTNGVELVNAGVRLRRGDSEPLENGEVIRIGDYEIHARINLDIENPEAALLNVDAVDSFEALMGRSSSAAPVALGMSSSAQFQGGAALGTFPDLFDFLTPNVPAATRSDHVPAECHDFRPPVAHAPSVPAAAPNALSTSSVIPEDWDLFADMPMASNPTPVVVGHPAPVTAAPPALTEAPLSPVPPKEAPNVLEAFLRGAGLDHLQIELANTEAQMASIGRSYRLMIEGLIDVLRARSSLKGEFRIQQTLIQPVENNPLKFAPNVDEALLLLLRHGNPAFLPPDQAIADSFNDLRAHQLAVMAGVEAAIKALLKRFEPAELEARMGQLGMLAKLFGTRQAQHWQRFTELYTQISREAEDDFQMLFGREFSRAYEEHSARLRHP